MKYLCGLEEQLLMSTSLHLREFYFEGASELKERMANIEYIKNKDKFIVVANFENMCYFTMYQIGEL